MTATDTPSVGGDQPELVPASFGQRRMWFLNQADPGKPGYNGAACLGAHGPLDKEILRSCVRQLVRQHDVLRTRLVLPDGELTQVIEPESVADTVDLKVVDLSGRLGDLAAEADRLIDEEVAQPFDLTTDLPIRVLVVDLAIDEHIVVLTTHHAHVDDWSILVLEWCLASWYLHFVSGTPAPRRPSARYADYCARQHQFVGNDQWRRELDYWSAQLDGAPARLEFHTEVGKSDSGDGRRDFGRRDYFALPASFMRRLGALAEARESDLFSATLAVFGVLLWRWTGNLDLPVGVPVTGRTPMEDSTVVGFFGNTVVARLRLNPELPFTAFLDQVHQVMAAANANQAVPFDAVVNQLRPRRKRGENPLFNTLFAMRLNRSTMRAGNVSFVPKADRGGDTAIVDLMILLERRDDNYYGLVEYRTDIFDEESARRMTDDYSRLLAEITAAPGVPVGELAAARPLTEKKAVDQADEHTAGGGAYRPAETDLERTVSAIWQELLGMADIGVNDDFVDLGGHSLLAAHVAMRVRERLAVAVPVSWFFDTPTIRGLAADIQDRQCADAVPVAEGDFDRRGSR